MNNDPRAFLPGDRALVFDRRLFVDDVQTPLAQTMQPATILRRYGTKSVYTHNVCYDEYGNKHGEPDVWIYPDLVDVQFDHDGRESKGHFTNGLQDLPTQRP